MKRKQLKKLIKNIYKYCQAQIEWIDTFKEDKDPLLKLIVKEDLEGRRLAYLDILMIIDNETEK